MSEFSLESIQNVVYRREAKVVLLGIHRPEARNALDLPTFKRLIYCLDQLKYEENLGAVVIYGDGGYFISGGDLKSLHNMKDEKEALAFSAQMQAALEGLSTLPCVVIAAIEGFAIGGGAEIALACDLRIMSEQAYFRFPHQTLGISTAWGGTRRLIDSVGYSQAFALLALADRIDAQRCLQLGLVQQIAPTSQVLQTAKQLAKQLSENANVLAEMKAIHRFNRQGQSAWDETERTKFAKLWVSEGHWRKVEAFWQNQEKKSNDVQIEQQKFAQKKQEIQSTNRGLFIVLEGIDGAGTTTQGHLITDWFKTHGKMAYLTKEPSDGTIGKLIRRGLKGEKLGHFAKPLPPESFALLFAADRADHWFNEVKPLLDEGVNVICDRYLYSSLAYQSQECPAAWVAHLNELFPTPDLLLYVRVRSETAELRRALRGGTQEIYEYREFQEKVVVAYDRYCKQGDAIVIDGEQSASEVFDSCISYIQKLL